MTTTLTSKGQVTIPKKVRDALKIGPGSAVEFAVNAAGEVIVRKSGVKILPRRDRFDAVRGKAQIRWQTDELMALLRG
jgi:AbrB family looped-hinge helix DNA binding protein